MISAFGIEHTISKSYVPGKGYKAASKLDDIERHIVRNKALGNKASYKAKGSPMQQAAARRKSNRKQIYEGQQTKRGRLERVLASRSQTGKPHAEGFSQPDGRGGGRVVVHTDADFKATSRHEVAHIAPRRNPVTMQERLKDPKRLGREEGRADFVASGRSTTGQYPGDDQFKSGYNEVQGKMAAAKYRKEKFRR